MKLNHQRILLLRDEDGNSERRQEKPMLDGIYKGQSHAPPSGGNLYQFALSSSCFLILCQSFIAKF